MTLKDFVKTIKAAGNIPGSLDDIAIELYKYSRLHFSDDTVKAVLHNKRSPKCSQGSIYESGFFQFFEERTNSTWREMQKAFSELDQYNIFDPKNEDQDVFYESLLFLFYDIFRVVPVSLCDILPCTPKIFGRTSEMTQIAEIFEESNYAILTGVGGIGKSSVALAYAHSLKKTSHWTVQHLICENTDTMQTAINKLQFCGLTDMPEHKKNAKEKNFESRIACLANSRRRMLLILDNLNRAFTPEDHNCFQMLNKCGDHVRILITSRNMLVDEKQCVLIANIKNIAKS